MGTTGTWNLPYPESTDAPNGPVQFKALAAATDTALSVANGNSQPRFAAHEVADKTVYGVTYTVIEPATIDYDTANMWSAPRGCVIIPSDGIYLFDLAVTWNVASARKTQLFMMVGDTVTSGQAYGSDATTISITGSLNQQTTAVIALAAGDIVWFGSYQSASTTATIKASQVSATRIGEYPPPTVVAASRRGIPLEPEGADAVD